MNLNCALTGHRDLPPDFDCNKLYDTLEELILFGYTNFYCGMARGFDLLALKCLVDLKQKHRIVITACIPFEGQENEFPLAEKRRYRELLEWCDEKIVFFTEYRAGCYHARDRFMVDRADLLLAHCTHDKGGTAYTVKYAISRDVEVRLV